MLAQVEDQQGQDSRVKNERLQVQSSRSQGQPQGTGTGVDREISGQDNQGTNVMFLTWLV